eukprot:CAMPEP_0204859088 /NCGR_PEP_ID=MMETSP1347-20130617/23478_1 /ASSEMBLY_ACC=CAM_ASM_000690 /TAXON_ID=215587 /ORGANISM="Aplanochytrium stocchinoi, Strain GSBS06" /LENGTH=181 /DNA_ID=CAMNT_0052007473 /DNA_START=48 /DNA_END=593 /DNA_ORIENTATION=-
MKGVASEQFDLFLKFGGSLIHKRDVLTSDFAPNTLLIDGLLGTGITRSPSGVVGELIEEVNKWGFRVLSCDIPSGLNHSTGEAYEPCIRAKWTLNYHVVKSGQVKGPRDLVGSLWTCETNLTFTRFGSDFGKRLKMLYASIAVNVIVKGPRDLVGSLWTCETNLTFTRFGYVSKPCTYKIT